MTTVGDLLTAVTAAACKYGIDTPVFVMDYEYGPDPLADARVVAGEVKAFWMSDGPVLMINDDSHWCDAPTGSQPVRARELKGLP